MFTHLLAIVMLTAPSEDTTLIVKATTSRTACMVEAEKLNRTHPAITQANPLKGIRAVCLRLEIPTV